MSPQTTVLICGGRDFGHVGIALGLSPKEVARRQYEIVYAETYLSNQLSDYMPELVIVHGGARGADSIADRWAKRNHISVKPHPADWDRFQKAAGPIRNQEMLDEEKPDLVIAFPGGRGTADMVSRARRSGVKIIAVPNP